jgi:hypothetical protein
MRRITGSPGRADTRAAHKIKRRLLIGMRGAQRIRYRSDHIIGADHLDTVLGQTLLLVLCPDERITASERTELPLAQHLPAATVIGGVTSSPRSKQRILHNLKMRLRNIDSQLVQILNPKS